MDVCPDLAGQPARAQAGTGSVDLELLAPGDALSVYQGPQRGFHVFGGARLRGVHTGTGGEGEDHPTVAFTLVCGGDVVAHKTRAVELEGTAESSFFFGEVIFLNTKFEDSLALEGRSAVFSFAVHDACGTSATDEVPVWLDVLEVHEQ